MTTKKSAGKWRKITQRCGALAVCLSRNYAQLRLVYFVSAYNLTLLTASQQSERLKAKEERKDVMHLQLVHLAATCLLTRCPHTIT